MEKLFKPRVLLPIITGIAAGALLFVFGASEDAPGVCVIGLSVAYVLVMRGIYNAGIIKKGVLVPILLFSFGAGAAFLSIVLLLDGELGEYPGFAAVGVAVGVAMIEIGTLKLKKARGKNV